MTWLLRAGLCAGHGLATYRRVFELVPLFLQKDRRSTRDGQYKHVARQSWIVRLSIRVVEHPHNLRLGPSGNPFTVFCTGYEGF